MLKDRAPTSTRLTISTSMDLLNTKLMVSSMIQNSTSYTPSSRKITNLLCTSNHLQLLVSSSNQEPQATLSSINSGLMIWVILTEPMLWNFLTTQLIPKQVTKHHLDFSTIKDPLLLPLAQKMSTGSSTRMSSPYQSPISRPSTDNAMTTLDITTSEKFNLSTKEESLETSNEDDEALVSKPNSYDNILTRIINHLYT